MFKAILCILLLTATALALAQAPPSLSQPPALQTPSSPPLLAVVGSAR